MDYRRLYGRERDREGDEHWYRHGNKALVHSQDRPRVRERGKDVVGGTDARDPLLVVNKDGDVGRRDRAARREEPDKQRHSSTFHAVHRDLASSDSDFDEQMQVIW